MNEIRNVCLRLLSCREHSRRELMDKLRRRGYEEDEIEQIVNALTEQRLQSERRFTEQHVSNPMGKGYGPRRIAQELRVKGIDLLLFEEVTRAENIDWLNVLGKPTREDTGTYCPSPLRNYKKDGAFFLNKEGLR